MRSTMIRPPSILRWWKIAGLGLLPLAVSVPTLVNAQCVPDNSKMADVLDQYRSRKFSCTVTRAFDNAGAINHLCQKFGGTGPLQKYLITAAVDRSSGCVVITDVTEKRLRNTSIRGLCRRGRPCNHGDNARAN